MIKNFLLLYGIAVLCLLCWATLPSYADAELVVHWTFDHIENSTIKDAVGNSDGIIEGNWTEGELVPGLYGNAMDFGSMANRHTIKIKNSQSISLVDDFTFESTIKPYDVSGFRTIVSKGNREITPEAINYYFDMRDGRPEMKFKDAEGKWIVYSTPDVTLKPNEWYQLIFTKKGRDVDIYVNGEKYSVSKYEDGQAINLLPNSHNAYIGAGTSSGSSSIDYLFSGLIDDIKIYRGIKKNISNNFQSEWELLLSENKKRTEAFEKEKKEAVRKKVKEIQDEYVSFFANSTGSKDVPFTVGTLPTSKRLVKDPKFFKELDFTSKIVDISAARNEYEGFNIIVLGNPVKDIQIEDITISDLVNHKGGSSITTDKITYGYVKDVTTTNPGVPVDFVGDFPDIIMNGVASFAVKKYSFTPVYFKVYTDDAPPGDYKGVVTIKSGAYTETVGVNLRVYNFTLPKKGSLRTALSFFEEYYAQWYGLKELSNKKKEQIYDFLLSYRLSPNNIYSSEPIHPDLQSLEKIKERTNFLTIQRYGNNKSVPQTTLEKQIKAIGEAIAKVKQAGLQDNMYYYSYDEFMGHYTDSKLAGATQINTALRKAYPELRLMQTSFPDDKIIDLFNVWVPLFDGFGTEKKRAILNQLKAKGDEIWWYTADGPLHPYPNFFLDYPVFDNRIISTLSYMYDVDGLLYWSINREWLTNMDIRREWPTADWKPYIYSVNTNQKKSRYGMGNYVYPGQSGELLPSVRLENMRDGLEDYEYFKTLDLSIKKLEASNIKDKATLLQKAKKMTIIPSNVAASVTEWSSNPEYLIKYRNHVGEMVTKINTKLNNEGH